MLQQDSSLRECPPSALQLYREYPFDADETFKQGLASVVAGLHDKSQEEMEVIVRRARVFYFNRVTGNSLTPESVAEHEPSLEAVPPAIDPVTDFAAQGHEETRLLSFTELRALIEEGKTDLIPNNRVISDALNNARPSESVTMPRKKPWETG